MARHTIPVGEVPMNRKTIVTRLHAWTCGVGLLAIAAVGCQSNIAGQTLPSANYLRDDIQFFRPGPETPLANQRRALEEYRAGRLGVGGDVPGAPDGGAGPGAGPGADGGFPAPGGGGPGGGGPGAGNPPIP